MQTKITTTREQLKASEWIKSCGYELDGLGQWRRLHESGKHHEFLTPEQATFFYRAAHPEPTSMEKDIKSKINNMTLKILNDETLEYLAAYAFSLMRSARNITLDRVEEEAKSEGLLGHDFEILRASVDRIRKEEL